MMAVGAAALPAFTNLLRTAQFPEKRILIKALTQTLRDGQLRPKEATAVLPCLEEVSRSEDRGAAQAASEAMSVIR